MLSRLPRPRPSRTSPQTSSRTMATRPSRSSKPRTVLDCAAGWRSRHLPTPRSIRRARVPSVEQMAAAPSTMAARRGRIRRIAQRLDGVAHELAGPPAPPAFHKHSDPAYLHPVLHEYVHLPQPSARSFRMENCNGVHHVDPTFIRSLVVCSRSLSCPSSPSLF